MSKKALPMIIFLAFLWGSTMVSARFSLDYFEVSTFIAVRMLLAGFVFLLAYPLVLKRPLPRDWNVIKYGVFLGIFGTALPMNLFVQRLELPVQRDHLCAFCSFPGICSHIGALYGAR